MIRVGMGICMLQRSRELAKAMARGAYFMEQGDYLIGEARRRVNNNIWCC